MKLQPLNISKDEAFKKMAAMCARREYCTGDILKKLQKYEFEEAEVNSIINKLIKQKFVDDSRYCRGYINDKIKFSKWGKIKIEYHLRSKGIAQETIRSAMEELSVEDSTEALKNILKQKRKSVKGNSDYEIKTKLIRFALSRGFSMSEIITQLDNLSLHDD